MYKCCEDVIPASKYNGNKGYIMSNLLKTSAVVIGLVASSFGVSAKQMTLEQYIGYTISSQIQLAQKDMQAQLQQSTYNMAFSYLNDDAAIPGRRPVVNISEVSEEEE